MKKSYFSLKKRPRYLYDRNCCNWWWEKISISVDTPTTFEKIYHYLGDIRRYEYLVDGAFYCMKKCETDGIDVTNSITDVELPYFFSEKYKHKIPLELTDKEYKSIFFKVA